MGISQGSFYFKASNTLKDERLAVGDIVLIDPNCEVTPGSIILAEPGRELRRMTEYDRADKIVGKVVRVYFNP